MAALLEVQDRTIGFPGATPVRGLSLTVAERETVAVVGESGSGKSLTALALLGLLPPSGAIRGGRILFGGTDLARLDAPSLRRLRGRDIAMVFQEPMTSLNPVLTIGRQVGEVLRLHQGLSRRVARVRAVELLDLVRIPDPAGRVDDYPHQLSGGQRQRAMIAIAVACRPRLLIASPRLLDGFHYTDGPLAEIPGSIASAIGQPGCPFVPRCPVARGACRAAMPPLLRAGPDRWAACPVTAQAAIARDAADGHAVRR